jgi:hypothetical protein
MRKVILSLLFSSIAYSQVVSTPPIPGGLNVKYFGPYSTSNSTSNYYWIQAYYATGRSPLAQKVIVNQPSSYTSSQFVLITWQAMPSAISYDILKTTSSTPPSGACNCAIAIGQSANSLADTGLPFLTYTVKGAAYQQTDAATLTLDLSSANYFETPLTVNTTVALTNLTANQVFTTCFIQNASSAYTVTYSAVMFGATTIGTTLSKRNCQIWQVDVTGTYAYALAAGQINE